MADTRFPGHQSKFHWMLNSVSTVWNIHKKYKETGDVNELDSPAFILQKLKNKDTSLRKMAGINEVSHTKLCV